MAQCLLQRGTYRIVPPSRNVRRTALLELRRTGKGDDLTISLSETGVVMDRYSVEAQTFGKPDDTGDSGGIVHENFAGSYHR